MPGGPAGDTAAMEVLRRFVGTARRSAAVTQLRGGRITAALRGDQPMPAASVIKLAIAMTAITTADRCRELHRFDIDDLPRTVHSSLLKVLDPDRRLSLREIIALSLAVSDNPTAQFLVDLIGATKINEYVHHLGCTSTVLTAGFRDEELGSTTRHNEMSAHDALILLGFAWRDSRFEHVLRAMENGVYKSRIGLRLPDDVRLANKTGSLDGVVNDIGLIVSPESVLAVAFFCAADEDPARAAIDIGDAAARLWELSGGHLDEP